MSELKKNNFVSRVNQLDAIHLERDIVRLLTDNLLENLQSLSPILFTRIKPEIDLLIQSGVWIGSVGKQLSTFGQQLLLLSYQPENLTTSRLFVHFVLTVLPIYVRSNAEHRFLNKYFLQQFINHGQTISRILSVLNFFRFLKTGKHPTIIDFLLGIDMISLHNKQRNIGYKYMTRELIWGGFMELLGSLLPIINVQKLQRLAKQFLHGGPADITFKTPQMDCNTKCAYCGDRPTLPYHMGCGHIYCYYCIHGNIISDSNFCCSSCGSKCLNILQIPVTGDI